MDNDALSQAQAHCKELQSEYRRLVTEQTAIKTEEYNCSKEYARLVEERSRWEGQLAEDEVAALVLAEELQSTKATLQVLNEQAAACASLRQQLLHKDRCSREQRCGKQDYLLSLPEEFYSSKYEAAKAEMLQLKRCLSEMKELEGDKAFVEARLAAAVKENEQILAAVSRTKKEVQEVLAFAASACAVTASVV